MVLVVQSVAPGSAIPASIVAWIVILIGYFYIRRVHFGHTVAEIISPGRWLLWPWRLIRYTFRAVGSGANMMEREEKERDWRRYQRWRRGRGRGRRGRRNDDDDNGGCFSPGCIVLVLGILLTLAIVALIIFLYYMLFTFIGIIALMASIALGVIEGILYFRKTDSAFQNEYVVGRRMWF